MPAIPERLVERCRLTPDGQRWLDRLPAAIRELENRWSLSLDAPFDREDVSCAWVARGVRKDGERLILKLGLPHMEAAGEIEALRFWNGDAMVRLLDADVDLNAMLLELCEPGTSLRAEPEPEQDAIIARLLRRLWRAPVPPHPFRPLKAMLAHWGEATMTAQSTWHDAGLVREGLQLFERLACPSRDDVLLVTDLHAGNVLRSHREPWLVIDPKPFIGDRAYDATQHLLNCWGRLLARPGETIRQFADLVEVDHARIRLWLFARAAAEPRDDWSEASFTLARMLA
jgi:streptomycin 6-kinase